MQTSYLDLEQRSDLRERKEALLQEHNQYLNSHPELKQVLNDFVSSCLIHKPRDVVKFATEYFSSFLEDKERSEVLSRTAPAAPSMLRAVMRLRPIVICGPSGVGKGTLINRIMNDYPSTFGFSVSHTTRAPRPGEVDGVHYHFASKQDMQEEIKQGKFIEYAEVHGNYYGTSIQGVADVTAQGKVCILDIDVQGAQQVKKTDLKPVFVFVSPPSMDELEKRLRGRGTETEEKIQLRLQNANKEVQFREQNPGFFDHVIINDNLDAAYEELKRVALPKTDALSP